MKKKCNICDSTRTGFLYDGIQKCDECGHVFFVPDLSDEEVARLYGKNYFFGSEYSDYLKEKKSLQKNFSLRFKVLRKFLEQSRHKNLLEIGSAYGFFLDGVRDKFDSVCGIDLSRDATDYAREELKLNAVNADFITHNFGSQKFDVVCMWDTIEHLRKPGEALEKIRNLMKKGSLIAITTGDVGSFNAKARKNKWRLMHPPTHIQYFSQKSLARLLDKHGFTIMYSRYCGFYRSIDLMAYEILAQSRKRSWLYNIIQKSGLGSVNLYLNLYDIRFVIACKK